MKPAPAIKERRLQEILSGFSQLRLIVLGDFFLDKYLVTDPALSETSIETGLEARQVVQIRCSPGAAGTVTNNLAALEVPEIRALGVLGDDGEGFDLERGLQSTGVLTEELIRLEGRFTPTYMKPMVREPSGERELERLDIKNRVSLPAAAEEELVRSLHSLLAGSRQGPTAVIVADQVQERNCGVVTDRIRGELARLAERHPEALFFADSRERIGEFTSVVIKPNLAEGARALGRDLPDSPGVAESLALALAHRTGRPVFLTLGERGILASDGTDSFHAPAPPVHEPIDIVGAGDSATAGIVCALCAGASLPEAAVIGNLCAAVTIRKLGTTGTASKEEILRAHRLLTGI